MNPSDSITLTLERPNIPINFLVDNILNCGLEVLSTALGFHSSINPKLTDLTAVILWANEIKAHAEGHGGMVTKEVNDGLVEKMIWAFDVMRDVGMIS
jgi:hypothetical protein